MPTATIPTAREWQAIFDGFTYRGATTRAGAERRPSGKLTAWVRITKDRKTVGGLQARAGIIDGKLVARLGPITALDDNLQRTGLGRALYTHIEDSLRAHGVNRIDVWPSQAASYLLAAQGYKLDDPRTLPQVVTTALAQLDRLQTPPALTSGLQRLASDVRTGRITTLAQLAAHGRDNTTMWPGKALLLAAEWEGHKNL